MVAEHPAVGGVRTGSDRPASLGVLADPYVSEWEVRAIENLQEELDVDVPLVVVDDAGVDDVFESRVGRTGVGIADVVRFWEHVRENRAKSLVLAEREIGRALGDRYPLQEYRHVEEVDVLDDAEFHHCRPDVDGLWSELPPETVDLVGRNCDHLVRFGFGLLRGDVLEETEYGVLSFHPADVRQYRGLGTWPAFANGDDTAGATLQRLDDSIDGGEIVAETDVDVGDCATLWELVERVLAAEIDLLTTGVRNLRDPSFEPTIVPEAELGEFYTERDRQTLAFSGRILARNLHGRLRRRLGGGAVDGGPDLDRKRSVRARDRTTDQR